MLLFGVVCLALVPLSEYIHQDKPFTTFVIIVCYRKGKSIIEKTFLRKEFNVTRRLFFCGLDHNYVFRSMSKLFCTTRFREKNLITIVLRIGNYFLIIYYKLCC